MIKSKYFSSSSSISISFASVFLLSSLFAACCFTFLYLQPLQYHHGSDNHLRHINQTTNIIESSPTPSSSPVVRNNSSDLLLLGDDDPIDPVRNSTAEAPSMAVNSMTIDDPIDPVRNSTAETPLMAVNSTINDDPIDPVLNSTAEASLMAVNSTTIDDPVLNSTSEAPLMAVDSTTIDPVLNSTAEAPLMAVNSTINDDPVLNSTAEAPLMAANSTTNDDPLMKKEVEKDLFKPPLNASAEERMAWFKETLPRMKIFESTKKSRSFDQRIQEFFKGCEVRIFMTWISPNRTLFGKREFLSLETALKAHPKGCVVIVSKTMDSKQGRDLVKPLVKLGHKVLPVDPDLSLLFADTPAGPWLEGLKAGESNPGKIPITWKLSKLLRLVLLYKYGGIYLDADVIVLKDMSELKNCVGLETMDGPGRLWKTLSNAVLIFDQKHPLLSILIKELTTTFDANNTISRVVMRVAFNDSTSYDFNMMSQNAFNPIERGKIAKYFRHPKDANETRWTYNEDFALKQQSYAVHLWDFVSHNFQIEQQSVIGRLFSDHCVLCQHVYDNTPSTSASTSTS